MTAKLMMNEDGYVGVKTSTDNDLTRLEAEITRLEQEVKNKKKSLYVQAVSMEEFIEQRKNEYVFL